MENHSFLNARFVNRDRTTILAQWQDNNDKSIVRTQYMEAKDNNVQYKELLNHTTIDDIYEYSVNYEREYRKGYERYVLDLAKREGLLYNGELNPEFYSDFVDFIFGNWDPEEEKERLFLFKLKLFENVPTIKDSTEKALKSKLRKAKNVAESLKIAMQIHEKSLKSQSSSESP